MNLRRISLSLVPLLALTVLAAACDGGDPALTTTSSLVTDPGEEESPTTSAAPSGQGASTTLVGESVGTYEIVAREPGTDGEVVYIVIGPGAYTDVDLENFVLDLYESGIATYGAEIFDDAAAATAYLKAEEDRTAAEVALIEQHHFVSLVGGTIIRFQGPFVDSGEFVVGS
ncbi:MAG TPA: hypothetical protein VI980_08275 [Acidimicrobiia bacterium]|nr:hypothetical protein [Acidimicrobiia bacterium]